MEKTLKGSGRLSDEHIDLAQEILKDQFPHIDGFQSPLLAQNHGFIPVPGEGKHFFVNYLEGIQLHHIDDNHWVTSCSIGREVAVHDSRFKLSSSLTHQLASIYRPFVIREEDGEEVDPLVYISPVQQQIVKDDCGAFGIAFAVHVLLGYKLEEVELTKAK